VNMLVSSQRHHPHPLDHTWLGLHSRSVVRTSKLEDVAVLQGLFPDLGIDEGDSVAKQRSASPTAAPDVTPVQRKITSQLQWARSFLENYETDAWQNLRESSFTSPCTKIIALKIEAATTEGDNTLKRLDTWASAMGNGKAFQKKYKDFTRLGSKVNKLVALHPHINVWGNFLKEQSINLDLSFELLMLKVSFMIHTEGTLIACFRDSLQLGLDDILCKMPVGPAVGAKALPPDEWLRGIVLQRLGCDIEAVDVQTCEEKAKEFAHDIAELLDILPTLKSVSKLQAFIKDLGILSVLFQATADSTSVKASQAAEAKKVLESASFSLLSPVLTYHPVGMELMSSLNSLMQRGASDEAADSRFDLAQQAFQDKGMFGVGMLSQNASVLVIKNASTILLGETYIFSVLVDALHQTLDAKTLWSPLRSEERAQEVQTFSQQICQSIICIDVVIASELDLQLSECVLTLQKPVNFDAANYDPSADWANVARIGKLSRIAEIEKFVKGKWVEENEKFLQAFESFGDSLDDVVVKKEVAHTTKIARLNRRMRAACVAMWEGLLSICRHSLPETAAQLMAEWKAEAVTEDTFLGKSLSFVRMMEDVSKLASFRLEVPGHEKSIDVIIAKTSEALAVDTHVEMTRLASLPGSLVNLPVVVHIKDVVQGLASDSTMVFGQACEVVGIRPVNSAVDFKSQSIQKMLATFVNPAMMPKSLEGVMLHFPQGHFNEVATTKAYDMMQEVLKVSPVMKLDVGTSVLRDESVGLPKAEVLVMLAYLHSVHQLASVFLYLGKELQPTDRCIENNTLKKSIVDVIDFAEVVCSDSLCKLQTDGNMVTALEALEVLWRFPMASVRSWLHSCSLAIKELQAKLLGAIVTNAHALALQVEKHTPKYSHFCDDKTVVKNLMRKHLVNNKFCDILGTDTVSLFHAIAFMGQLTCKWALMHPKDDTVHQDAMQHIDVVYNEAKRTLQVIGAAKIWLCQTGLGQKQAADAFLKRPNVELPKALHEEILKVSNTGAVAKKRLAADAGLKPE
jgi:hypothetical protein